MASRAQCEHLTRYIKIYEAGVIKTIYYALTCLLKGEICSPTFFKAKKIVFLEERLYGVVH